jgi:hypothetical protein
MVAKTLLVFFRSDLPNLTPLISQFVWDIDVGISRLMTTPTKCPQSGPDCLMACVIADSNVVLEIDCRCGISITTVYLSMVQPF